MNSTNPLHGYWFAQQYLAGESAALGFFRLGPGKLAESVAARDAHPVEPWASHEIRELTQANLGWGNPGGARLGEMLADPKTLVVVTGQQPNLLASPMYILYKALTAWQLAEHIGQATGRPVVPVFWVGSDDHDFEELRHCWVATREGRLEDLGALVSRGAQVPKASPAFEWQLGGASRERVLELLARTLPASAGALQLAAQALTEPVDFESQFCRTLVALLGRRSMVLLPARLGALRRRQLPILRREFLHPEETFEALQARAEQLVAAGYQPQVNRNRGVLNAFHIDKRVRGRLVRRNGQVEVETPDTRELLGQFSLEELLEQLELQPERFSPNVVTRPLVQDAALPSVAYVAGPGEISYLAQLGPVYQIHGVLQPVVVPRVFATLADGAIIGQLAEAGVRVEAFLESPEEARRQILRTNPEIARLLEQTEQLQRRVADALEEFASEPRARHPHLQSAVNKSRSTMLYGVERLRERIVRHFGAQGSQAYALCQRAQSLLHPLGQAQERVLSPLTFLESGAPHQLVDRLEQAGLRLDERWPQLLRLDDAVLI